MAAAAKTEAAPAAAPDKAQATASAPDKGSVPPEKSAAAAGSHRPGMGAWAAAIAAIVLAPALSWAVAQFVMLPHLQKKLAAPAPAADAEASASGESDGKDGKVKDAPPTYEFSHVVVNLSGTMGTRLLTASFIVTGPAADLNKVFEANKARLMDVTLNVLSALTMADLEEPGSRNVLREKLVASYNQALGRKVADQVYFSDFVVQ